MYFLFTQGSQNIRLFKSFFDELKPLQFPGSGFLLHLPSGSSAAQSESSCLSRQALLAYSERLLRFSGTRPYLPVPAELWVADSARLPCPPTLSSLWLLYIHNRNDSIRNSLHSGFRTKTTTLKTRGSGPLIVRIISSSIFMRINEME